MRARCTFKRHAMKRIAGQRVTCLWQANPPMALVIHLQFFFTPYIRALSRTSRRGIKKIDDKRNNE